MFSIEVDLTIYTLSWNIKLFISTSIEFNIFILCLRWTHCSWCNIKYLNIATNPLNSNNAQSLQPGNQENLQLEQYNPYQNNNPTSFNNDTWSSNNINHQSNNQNMRQIWNIFMININLFFYYFVIQKCKIINYNNI